MMIEVNYVHFHNLNRNVLDLGKQVRELAEDKARYREMCDELDAECTRLKAEVERLTKAGDELHAFLINYIVESRISSAYLNKLDDGWNAAKEGKGHA